MKRTCRAVLTAAITLLAGYSAADDQRLTIYLDADFTLMPAPAQAIELGLKTAFADTWAEEGINLVIRDHRANSRRSYDSIMLASQDASALAVVGGMHSPPYLIHGDAINGAQIPLLLPWSAGAMLTRQAQGSENWIFRVSVDDTKTADFLVEAGSRVGCQAPSIVYVENSWGEGNATSIGQRLLQRLGSSGARSPLALNASDQTIADTVATIGSTGIDCVFLFSGLRLGAKVIQYLAALPMPPQVISHWGLLGARITDMVPVVEAQRLNLVILGTCGLSDRTRQSPLYARAVAQAGAIERGSFRPEHHPAVHGFFHAYDLGKLILQAIDDAHVNPQWYRSTADRRRAFRDALYRLSTPVDGLLKRYEQPFTPVATGNPDGHEALGFNDLCLTRIDEDGHLDPLPRFVDGSEE